MSPVCFLAKSIIFDVRAVGTSTKAQARWYVPMPVNILAASISKAVMLSSLRFIVNRPAKLHNPGKGKKDESSEERTRDFSRCCKQQGFKPGLVQEIKKRNICYEEHHHGKGFLLWLFDNRFQFRLYDSDI